MPAAIEVQERVIALLTSFLVATGRENPIIGDQTHLTRDLGLSSDEGVDFVLELCDAFNFDFPMDFNPFVHENGRRGRRVREMVRAIDLHLAAAQVTA